MAIMKKYGRLFFKNNMWQIDSAPPHVCIKLKSIFAKISKGATQPFKFLDTTENCFDLLWFMERYPLEVSDDDLRKLQKSKKEHIKRQNEIEFIFTPEYKPVPVKLKGEYDNRDYQLVGKDLYIKVKRLLIGDDLGLGKTMIAMLSFIHSDLVLPAAVVVEAHLPDQWKGFINDFTDLRVHIIKKTTPYTLPDADIYIFSYSKLSGWSNLFETKFFKSCVFDEVQNLRITASNKYEGGKALSSNVEYCLGLSATPIYNYGDEIYNVLDLINEGCLGLRADFNREWCDSYGRIVKDPKALGTYLRDNFLFLRRTREEVGRELPEVNKIVYTVDYDQKVAQNATEIAKKLAIKAVSGTSFMERGQASRELDIFVRHMTGVAKAKSVAEFVKILLENKEPVILAGWHRDVYEIWMKELEEFKPVLYTGTESPAQKRKSKEAFVSGQTNLFIISLRSGVGLDGLQHMCKTVVIGELDWSPKVHDQLIGRANRDGQKEQVTVFYLVSEDGSDPLIINLLGLKSSQSSNIVDPLISVQPQYSDESRIKLLAQQYLSKKELKAKIN